VKKILITGATGFVGSALIRALSKNHNVIGTDNHEGEGVSVLWDLRHDLSKTSLPETADVIIHSGGLVGASQAHTPDDYYRINARSCRQLADYANSAGTSQFIYFSTGAVHGEHTGFSTEDTALAPVGAYAVSKAQGELELYRLAGTMNLVIARLYFPYGPGQTGRFIPNLITSIRTDCAVRLNNKEGSPRLNPVYITDLVAGVTALVEKGLSGTWNFAGPDEVTVRELAEIIGRLLDKKIVFEEGEMEPFDFLGDTSRLRSLLGGRKMVGLEEGLAQVVRG